MNFDEMAAHYKNLYHRDLLEDDLEIVLKSFVLDKTKKYDKIVLDKLVAAEFRAIGTALEMLTELEERKKRRDDGTSDESAHSENSDGHAKDGATSRKKRRDTPSVGG